MSAYFNVSTLYMVISIINNDICDVNCFVDFNNKVLNCLSV